MTNQHTQERDLKGRYASTKNFVNKWSITVIFTVLFVACGVASVHAQKPTIPAASLSTEVTTPRERLIREETEAELVRPAFQKDTYDRARINVIERLDDYARTDMYNYLHNEGRYASSTRN